MEEERSRCVTVRPRAWSNHPAVLMWKGYEEALLEYLLQCCTEWVCRGYEDNVWSNHGAPRALTTFQTDRFAFPKWLGDDRLHSSHRAALLFKNPKHYKQFNWTEEPKMDYFWPTKHGY